MIELQHLGFFCLFSCGKRRTQEWEEKESATLHTSGALAALAAIFSTSSLLWFTAWEAAQRRREIQESGRGQGLAPPRGWRPRQGAAWSS